MGAVNMYHVDDFFYSQTYELTFSNLSPNALEDIKMHGVRLFLFCDGIVDSLASMFSTLLMFVGGLSADPNLPIIGSHVPPYMEKANVDFIKETMGWEMKERAV